MASSAQDSPPKTLNFAALLNEDRMIHHDFTDFIIVCEKQEFHVHRAVIGPQSEFFGIAMSGFWKESQAKRIELPDEDEASSVALFLEILYEDPENKIEIENHQYLLPWTKMFVFADKYLAPRVRAKASAMIAELQRYYWVESDDLAASLELAYGPPLSQSVLPRSLYQCFVFESMRSGNIDEKILAVFESLNIPAKDFLQFMAKQMMHAYCCTVCKGLTYTDKKSTSVDCEASDCSGRLREVKGAMVKSSNWD